MYTNKYIWLFGENLGKTMSNNSFYFWEHIVNKYQHKDVEAFLILEHTKENISKVKKLNKLERNHILWKNSFKHQFYYKIADLFFVTLSYKDVIPNFFIKRPIEHKLIKPLIYLQHGTTAIKKLGYHSKSFNNNFYRLVYYNSLIKNEIIKKNGFKDYQFLYSEGHPRYKAMFLKNKILTHKNQILWFLTWREYFGENKETNQLIDDIKSVVCDETLIKYLNKHKTTFKICLHQFFDEEKKKYILDGINCKYIELVHANEIDVMDELVVSKLLITDYSSIGFDFTMLNKPVIMYQTDASEYFKHREIYCEVDELNKYSLNNKQKLINTIINNKAKINQFFKKRLPKKIDPKIYETGEHIDKMYNYFLNNLKEKVTFIGYNFYGQGGTVTATKSLSEGLLEKGYMVELLSLKRNYPPKGFPAALNYKALYVEKSNRKIEILKRKMFNNPKYFSYINYDENKAYLIPYVGIALKRKLKTIKSGTLVSTRESLHMFVYNAKSPNINNKIYFFHSPSTLVNKTYPGCLDLLKNYSLDKAAFVTDKDRIQYEREHKYNHYKTYGIMGNCLESQNSITKDKIKAVSKKDKYKGIYLTRISKDRIDDLNSLLEFGEYLKKNNQKNIQIDIFGTGDYVKEFTKQLEDKKLKDYINYQGLTKEACKEIRNHDFLIDLSTNHSFGMIYIEGIMNGKMVFAKKNFGSQEVLKGCNKCFIKSWEDLTKKISDLDKIGETQIQSYYDKLSRKYSRDAVATNFINLLNQGKSGKLK